MRQTLVQQWTSCSSTKIKYAPELRSDFLFPSEYRVSPKRYRWNASKTSRRASFGHVDSGLRRLSAPGAGPAGRMHFQTNGVGATMTFFCISRLRLRKKRAVLPPSYWLSLFAPPIDWERTDRRLSDLYRTIRPNFLCESSPKINFADSNPNSVCPRNSECSQSRSVLHQWRRRGWCSLSERLLPAIPF